VVSTIKCNGFWSSTFRLRFGEANVLMLGLHPKETKLTNALRVDFFFLILNQNIFKKAYKIYFISLQRVGHLIFPISFQSHHLHITILCSRSFRGLLKLVSLSLSYVRKVFSGPYYSRYFLSFIAALVCVNFRRFKGRNCCLSFLPSVILRMLTDDQILVSKTDFFEELSSVGP